MTKIAEPSGQRQVQLVLVLAWVMGCSSGAQPGGSRIASEPSPAPANMSTNAAAASSAAVGGVPSNSTFVVPVSQPVTPSSNTVAGVAQMPKASTRDPIAIDECGAQNPAGISASDVQALRAGGSSDGLRLLYPYDGTVFPRGLIAPDVLWEGPNADAVFVHIQSKIFEYSACLPETGKGQLTLPQDVWDIAGQRTFGKDDVYSLELTVLSQGSVFGPVKSTFKIAQATIKGSIYYNSYSSQLGANAMRSMRSTMTPAFPGAPPPIMGGLVLRIPAGGSAELFGLTDCNGCHSVSSDGSRLLSQFVNLGGETYELSATGMTPAPVTAGPRGAFGALYPDGSAYLTGSSVIEVARSNMTAAGATGDATLHDTNNGEVIPNVGIPKGVLMPMFSPDGTFLVFNDYAADTAHGLAVMRYDVTKHTASDYRVLTTEPPGDMRPGWPFVLPDNGGVVFVRTNGPDFSGNGAGVAATSGLGGFGGPQSGEPPPFSELSIVDMASGMVTLLAKAMGYDKPEDASSETTYLPFGKAELHHNYFPTVSPVAAGGYFWIFFDSIRHYGGFGSGRQLWGAAIDISPDGTYTTDLSHPAFYLPGQEFGTGNHRAFAALDPCRKDGDRCTSGIDCCGGFCYLDGPEELAEPIGSCTPKMTMCAKRDERCVTDADCCPPEPGEPTNTCIAGYCAFIPPLN